MLNNIIYSLIKKITGIIKYIPDKYKKEFDEAVITINLRRTKFFCISLLILNSLLLLIDLKYYKPSWNNIEGYRVLFKAHVIILLFLSLYLYLTRLNNITSRLKKYQNRLFILVILSWSAFLAINAQSIHGQVSAYIIASFCLACAYLLTKYERLILFTSTYAYIILGLVLIRGNFQTLMGNLINLTFSYILSLYISKVNYEQYLKNFKDQKIILKQTEEMEKSKDSLEILIKERTAELFKANELIMKEINIRQGAEIESLKARLLYEEKSRLLDESREYESVRSNFFANVSHELKTPVNIIYSSLQMMEFMLQGEKTEQRNYKINKYMSIIRQNCFRLTRIVGNIIDITKIDAKHFEINLRNCDIVKVVQSITLSVTEHIENRKINLLFQSDMQEKIIACDPEIIERIILNLLSNAVKFTSRDGAICVRMSSADAKIIIAVRDTGIGIPEAKKGIIFDRFVQAGKPLNSSAQGSGIGLSLVKELVELHNGTIGLVSESNKGSEFFIELPDIVMEGYGEELAAAYIDTSYIDRISIEFSDI